MRWMICWLSIGLLGVGAGAGCGETGDVELSVTPDPGSQLSAGRFALRLNWAGNVSNPTADFTLDGDEGTGGALEGRQFSLTFPSAWLRDGAEIPVNRVNGGELYFHDISTYPYRPGWEELATGFTYAPDGTLLHRGWFATCGSLKVREHAVLGDGVRQFVLEGRGLRLATLDADGQQNAEPASIDVTIRVKRSDYIFPEGQGLDLTSDVGPYRFEVPPQEPPAPLCDAPVVVPAAPPPLVTRQGDLKGPPLVLDDPAE